MAVQFQFNATNGGQILCTGGEKKKKTILWNWLQLFAQLSRQIRNLSYSPNTPRIDQSSTASRTKDAIDESEFIIEMIH